MDFAAMSIIVVIVGLMTFISPVPPNEPLYWHEMGEKVHMTVQVTPNVPGDNQFQVYVWLPKELGKPKQVMLRAQNQDKPELAPIDIPLVEFAGIGQDASFGTSETLTEFDYKAEGPFLPFPGLWKLEFRVMDSNDDETVYAKEVRLY
jgi:copper transport protein